MVCETQSAALDYAECGYPVFPCAAGTKKPRQGSAGLRDATTDAAQVRAWWEIEPHNNIAIATAGLLVVDTDGAENPWPADPAQRADLDSAPTAGTPRGGRHHIFRQPAGRAWRNSTGRLAPAVDTRALGGYIVAAPSMVDGRAYRWLTPLPARADLPYPPAWLVAQLDALAKPKGRGGNGVVQHGQLPAYIQAALDAELGRVAMASEGTRNDTLNRAAFAIGTIVGAGALDRAMVERLLADAASRCGLPPREAASTIRSGIEAGIAQPRQSPERGKPTRTPKAGETANDATEIIHKYFIGRYQPSFRRGAIVHCADGDDLKMQVAIVPNSEIIQLLATAANAPRDKHGVNTDALPGFFKKWAPVAWGDLLAELPDEVSATLADDAPARETFTRLVREALYTQITLGTVIRGKKTEDDVTQTERRSVISWCDKLARVGPWRDIRSLACWCKRRELQGGELELHVAIRHEVFAQVGADKRLREMGATMFARLAGKYGVGVSSKKDRPQGRRAIVIDRAIVDDLTTGIPDEENLPSATPADGQ